MSTRGTIPGFMISQFLPESTSVLILREILLCKPPRGLNLRPSQQYGGPRKVIKVHGSSSSAAVRASAGLLNKGCFLPTRVITESLNLPACVFTHLTETEEVPKESESLPGEQGLKFCGESLDIQERGEERGLGP